MISPRPLPARPWASPALRALALWALGALLACAPPPPEPEAQVHREGARVDWASGITQLTLRGPGGAPLQTRRAPAPVPRLDLAFPWTEGGAYTLEILGPEGLRSAPLTVPEAFPAFEATLQAPGIPEGLALNDGDAIPLVLFAPPGEGADGPRLAVVAEAFAPGPLRVRVGDAEATGAPALGERIRAEAALTGETDIEVTGGGETLRARIALRVLSPEDAAALLEVRAVDFPVEPGGTRDLARATDRIQLPAPWWAAILRETGFGFRARNIEAPWGHQAITLYNSGDLPLNLAIESRVLDPAGAPAEAFFPWLRMGDDGSGRVRALLRIPPRSSARATLPFFLHEGRLPEALPPSYTRQLRIVPLGAGEPLMTWTGPLYVSRGSTLASLGLAFAIAAALGGLGLIALRLRPWLRRPSTSALMAIALFGTLTFIVGAAGRLLAMGVAAALGPFGLFVSALIDEVFRYTLLGTIILLYPRPGTAALALLVDWLLSGFALGAFGPTDLFLVGGRVLWMELALWAFGVTRALQGDAAQGLRLGAAFGAASLVSSATGIVLQMTLYRLYLADWYIALVLLLPGFAYVLLATALALPFARSIRGVAR